MSVAPDQRRRCGDDARGEARADEGCLDPDAVPAAEPACDQHLGVRHVGAVSRVQRGLEAEPAQESGADRADLGRAQQRAVVLRAFDPAAREVARLRQPAELDDNGQRVGLAPHRRAEPRRGRHFTARRERGIEEVAVRLQLRREPRRVIGIRREFRRRGLHAQLLEERDVLVDDAAQGRGSRRRKRIAHAVERRRGIPARDPLQRKPSQMHRAIAIGEEAHGAFIIPA